MKGIARNVAEYNSLTGETLPYYIIIIDEFADVIALDKELALSEDKDDKRTRIAAKISQLAAISRAAGIHIIIATQRPSVKVINGDIKSNFPTRICFKLPSSVDSRTVLDEGGAEYLLGKGDYLFRTANDGSPKRGHGAFITLEGIAKVLSQADEIRKNLKYLALR